MRITSNSIDREEIKRKLGHDVDRVVEFVLRKSIYNGGFYSEGTVEYDSFAHAYQTIMRELNIFLSGFGFKVYYMRNPDLDGFVTFHSDDDQHLFSAKVYGNEIYLNA